MAKVRVGINGFGRIGRLAFRAIMEKPELEVVAINDLADAATNAHLLKYDSVHGKFSGTVEVVDGDLVVNGQRVKVLSERSPANLGWGELGVEIVLESTGIFTAASGPKGGYGDHLTAGAKKVILSAPSKDKKGEGQTPGVDYVKTIVLGVNDDDMKPQDKFFSNASCTTNCLAPVVKVLHETFGVKRGLMTTCHAYTNDQQITDLVHKDLRRARAAAMSIIPTTTGAAKAIGLVIPELAGKLDGMAMRVPTPDGSVVDLTAELDKSVTVEEVNAAIKSAAQGELAGILEYCDDPIVSIDIIHNPASSIFDSLCTMTTPKEGGNLVKIVSWYDNEWGFSCRTAELMVKIGTM